MNDVCACMGITYELVFFHKVLQFNHMYAGLLVLIGQIADGFATVFVGIFSDKGNVLLTKVCILLNSNLEIR